MGPDISIVTPSFNQGRFIERTIASVLGQQVPGLEYFVADGGSTDGTVAILSRYGQRLKWVSEGDRGQADAVNKGIGKTTGGIIGWLNSDDVYYPGAVACVRDYFRRHPEVDIVYGDAGHIDLDDRVIEPYPTEDWDYERLKEVCFICQPSVFFRRSLVDRVGLLDDSLQYCMDYEYWLRIGAVTPFHRIGRPLAGSRYYRDNKTLGKRSEVHLEICRMFAGRLGTVPSKWVFAYSHALADQRGCIEARRTAQLAH